MTGYERYLNVRNGEAADVLPRLPILMQFAAEHIGSNYGAFASDWRVLAEANLRCALDFEFDQLSAISDPYRETQGFGAAIEYLPNSVPRCVVPPLAGDRNLARLPKPDPMTSERMLDRILAVRAMREKAEDRFSVMGWVEGPAAEAADLRDVCGFLIDLMDDEGYCEELMDICLATAIEFAVAQVDAGADTIGIGDAIASQVSPDMYERLVFPREKILTDAIHAAGAQVRLHICGDTTKILPAIGALGVDILDCDHMVDMARAREAVGRGVVLAGNIDPVSGVRYGRPGTIRDTLRRTYDLVGNPYMITAGCEIPSGTPPENLRALCEPIPYRA